MVLQDQRLYRALGGNRNAPIALAPAKPAYLGTEVQRQEPLSSFEAIGAQR